MLCACSSSSSGEQFKFDDDQVLPPPQSQSQSQSPLESLATRDFSLSGLSSSSRTGGGGGDWDSRFEDNGSQVHDDDIESTLKQAISLNYEEARALLGRLEYQRGNFDAALQVFQGIDIRGLTPRMTKAIIIIASTTTTHQQQQQQRKGGRRHSHSHSHNHNHKGGGGGGGGGKNNNNNNNNNNSQQISIMSMHSVSLLLEAILLKAKSLEELGRPKDAAMDCQIILDTVESALPNGMPQGITEDCKLQEMFHKALELLPMLWKQAGFLDEAITAYRRVLTKPWNLDPQRLASVQKDLAAILLYGGVEASLPPHSQIWGGAAAATPKNNTEEAILLLFILMQKVAFQEIVWDPEIIEHLTYALTLSGQFGPLADHFEQALPGIYNRAKRWYLLALCYTSAGQNEVALNLLKKVSGHSEAEHEPHLPSLLLGAKLCSQNPEHAHDGIEFARRAANFSMHHNDHFLGKAHQLLGVCYGTAARLSVSDSQRFLLESESLKYLSNAALLEKDDPEVLFNFGLENAVQRNLTAAIENVRNYSDMVGGSSASGWKLLALLVSTEQRFKDAETIIDLAFDDAERRDQLELLRLKAVLQISQEQPKTAIQTYRILLALIQAQKEFKTNKNDSEVVTETNLEMEAWQDLADIYTKLGSWHDAEICVDKAKSIGFYSPKSWHATGMLFEAQSFYKEALVAFSKALSIEPNYVPSMVSTAAILRKLGLQALPIARSFLMNALRLEPTNHEAWLNLGYVSKMEGSLLLAADFFQAAHELKQSAPVQNFI